MIQEPKNDQNGFAPIDIDQFEQTLIPKEIKKDANWLEIVPFVLSAIALIGVIGLAIALASGVFDKANDEQAPTTVIDQADDEITPEPEANAEVSSEATVDVPEEVASGVTETPEITEDPTLAPTTIPTLTPIPTVAVNLSLQFDDESDNETTIYRANVRPYEIKVIRDGSLSTVTDNIAVTVEQGFLTTYTTGYAQDYCKTVVQGEQTLNIQMDTAETEVMVLYCAPKELATGSNADGAMNITATIADNSMRTGTVSVTRELVTETINLEITQFATALTDETEACLDEDWGTQLQNYISFKLTWSLDDEAQRLYAPQFLWSPNENLEIRYVDSECANLQIFTSSESLLLGPGFDYNMRLYIKPIDGADENITSDVDVILPELVFNHIGTSTVNINSTSQNRYQMLPLITISREDGLIVFEDADALSAPILGANDLVVGDSFVAQASSPGSSEPWVQVGPINNNGIFVQGWVYGDRNNNYRVIGSLDTLEEVIPEESE